MSLIINVPPQPKRMSRGDACQEFSEYARLNGYEIGYPVADGKIHRFKIGNSKKKNGFYSLHADDEYPMGIIGDWRRQGDYDTWEGGVSGETGVTKAEIRERWRKLQEARAAKEAAAAQTAAQQCLDKWRTSPEADPAHPYLAAKGIRPHGLRQASDGFLLVPVYNDSGRMISLQRIRNSETKLFWKDSQTKGGRFHLGAKLAHGRPVVICEGFATGASIAEALPDACVFVCFSAGQLKGVAQDVRQRRADAPIVIAADDDSQTDGNPGVTEARKAAEAVQGRVAIPALEGHAGALDFNDLFLKAGSAAVAQQITRAFREADIDPENQWRDLLVKNGKGDLDRLCVANHRLFVAKHPDMAERLAFNEFTGRVEIARTPWDASAEVRPMTDIDVNHCREWLQRQGLKAPREDVRDAMETAAHARKYHPVRDYLSKLRWDGKQRLDDWLTTYMGADPSPYVRAVAAKTLIGACARIMQPGCKVDTMLVFEGDQGVGKSTAIAALFGQQWTHVGVNLFDKHQDMVMSMMGAWCVEIAELAAMRRAEQEKIKALLTIQVDNVRMPYARLAMDYPRQSILIGTINPNADGAYLSDETGGRRFWPVKTKTVRLARIREDRDQLWAEAMYRYRRDERWWLEGDENDLAKTEQEDRRTEHPWEDILRRDIAFMSREQVTINEAFAVIEISKKDRSKHMQMQMAEVLKRIGRVRRKERTDRGPEWVWVLKNAPEKRTYSIEETWDFEV